MRLGMVLLERDGAPELCQRVIQATPLAQGQSEGEASVREILLRSKKLRLQINGFGEMIDRPLQLSHAAKSFAHVVVKIRDPVVRRDGLADQLGGEFVAAGLDREDSEQIKAIEMSRNSLQNLPVKTFGLREVASLVQLDRFGKKLLGAVCHDGDAAVCRLRSWRTA